MSRAEGGASAWRRNSAALILLRGVWLGAGLAATALHGADWPQWRGPDRNGVAAAGPALADAWPPDGPPRLWESEPIPGGQDGGMGSVTVADGRVLVFTCRGGVPKPNGTQAMPGGDGVLCLDADTGKTLWRQTFDGWMHGYAASPTITIHDGRLYFAGSNRCLYCLDAATGKLVWVAMTEQQPNRISSSVCVVGQAAILLAGRLTAYSVEDGELLWRQDTVSTDDPSPLCWTRGGRKYLLCNTASEVGGPAKVFCVRPDTGDVVWSVPGGSFSSVVFSGDTMVVQRNASLEAFRLDAAQAQPLWSVAGGDRGASPVIWDGCVYAFGGGKLRCVTLDAGQLRWQAPMPGSISSPIVADGKLILVTHDGKALTMVRATPEQFTLLAKAPLKIAACSSPAYADGKLFLRLAAGVACFDLTRTGGN